MKAFNTRLLWLVPTMLSWCFTGCTNGETHITTSEEHVDKTIPAELLNPGFLQSLSLSIANDNARSEIEPQPLHISSNSPECEEARKLLVWLLSAEDVKILPPTICDTRLPLRVRYHSEVGQGVAFAVFAEPTIGYEVEVYRWEKGAELGELIRRLECDGRMEKRINDLWEMCARAHHKS